MTGFQENVQKPNFRHLIPLNPRIKMFFQNSGRVTFFTLLTPIFMQSFRKLNERSPRYLKINGLADGLTDGQGRLPWTPSGKPGVQNYKKTAKLG